MLNWDDLNFFRSIAYEKSFRRAAAKLKLSVNTIRARVGRLEEALGMPLFARGRDGLTLSADGITALNIALDMEAASLRLIPGRPSDKMSVDGELKICCSDGIGEFWLVPRLESLQRRLPVAVTFRCDFDQGRIHSPEHDICIGFTRPTNPDTIVCKIATIHFMLCASRDYLNRHANPQSIQELENHRFIVHDSYGLDFSALHNLVGEDAARRLIVIKTNTSGALNQAVESGLGIGALPTYLCTDSKSIQPIDLDLGLKSDLWLSFSRSSGTHQPVRDTIDWLKACFRLSDYPWFGESLICPGQGAKGWVENAGSSADTSSSERLVPAEGTAN